jgi:hypothetical protein
MVHIAKSELHFGQLTLNPNSASAPSCSKEQDPTESVDCAQGKRTTLHESAANSKTN